MDQYLVYILRCHDGSFYTGFTNDLERRLNEHNIGANFNCYTFKRRPLELLFIQKFEDVIQAIVYEKKLKGWSRLKKQSLVDGDFDRLKILAECRNATHHKYKPE
ncbi:GIY-YIG nuclease family protein [Gramella lutea]|uniref:GIY-YIG nuclease family protein n=1 Tax=Christiangramia lutea TaxID=1607951 RepID=A0A9X2A9D1_9FLAO|nr:GIY-YIG nuclease family protein [Christiangramia lutea]MCH4821951.1 GIY-YIG nuclease family protein [Christiangramia lutea]